MTAQRGDGEGARPVSRRRWWPFFALPLPALAALAFGKRFGIDEFLYLHWGAEAAQGRFAGVDYFAAHFPLLQFVLAPLFLPGGGSCSAPMLAARALMLALFVAAAASASGFVTRPGARAPAVLLLLLTHALAVPAVEIRPDILALALFAGGALLYLRTDGAPPAVGAGLLLGFAVLASEKVLILGLAFAATLLVGLRADRRAGAPAPALRRAACCAAAFSALVGLALVALWRADGLHQARLWLEFSRLHEALYPAESYARLARAASLLLLAPHFALAPLGAWVILRRLRQARPAAAGAAARDRTCDLFVLAAGIAALLVVVLQRAPYSYSWMPFFLFGGIWVLEGVVFLGPGIRDRLPRLTGRSARALVAAVVLLFVGGELALAFALLAHETNRPQLAGVERICRLTAPDDCVYDNSAIAFARRHADDFFVQTDAVMRFTLRRELATRIPLAIRERSCAVYVRDARAADLPRRLTGFLRAHYLPVGDDIYIWGSRFPAGRGTVRFDAVAAGQYYFWPESATLASGAATVALPRGESALEVVAPEAFYLLWLPRDGERLAPVPEGIGSAAGPFSLR